MQDDAAGAQTTRFSLSAWILLTAAVLGMVSLHVYPLLHPWLFDDDFTLLTESWDWPTTRQNILLPYHNNVWPLERLASYGVLRLAGRVTALPRMASLLGPVALALTIVLVYLFVKREMGHRFYGLVAAIIFGVSLKYNQAVTWYSAAFLTVMLDTLLLALLSAQSWRRTGRVSTMIWVVVWVALAPAWYPTGILAGPLCCLYLWPREEDVAGEFENHHIGGRWWIPKNVFKLFISRSSSFIPLFGTMAYLAISLPQNLNRLFFAKRVDGQNLMETFDPIVGLAYTARSFVDNLILGALGASGSTCPPWLLPVPLVLIGLAGFWWWRRAPRRRLLLLGCGLILFSYWLTYSARASLPYAGEEHSVSQWSRYQLLPFLGLVLFACGGLPSRQGTLFQLDQSGQLTRGQTGALAVLLAILVGLQFPVSWIGHMRTDYDAEEQMAVLRHIEEVDARCQANRISTETASQALGFLEIPYSTTPGSGYPPRINGWQWLRGSDDPLPQENLDEVRHRLLD
jgi:hypothetical protein